MSREIQQKLSEIAKRRWAQKRRHIVRRFLAGESPEEIARSHGIRVDTIERYVREHEEGQRTK